MSKIYILEDSPERMKKFNAEFRIGNDYFHSETARGMIDALEKCEDRIDILFLDHDLDGEVYVDSSNKNTGMEVVRWLVKNKRDIGLVVVHTLNPSAGHEMVWRLGHDNYVFARIPFTRLNFSGTLEEDLLHQLTALKRPN